jgi:hypothetical protein
MVAGGGYIHVAALGFGIAQKQRRLGFFATLFKPTCEAHCVLELFPSSSPLTGEKQGVSPGPVHPGQENFGASGFVNADGALEIW